MLYYSEAAVEFKIIEKASRTPANFSLIYIAPSKKSITVITNRLFSAKLRR